MVGRGRYLTFLVYVLYVGTEYKADSSALKGAGLDFLVPYLMTNAHRD